MGQKTYAAPIEPVLLSVNQTRTVLGNIGRTQVCDLVRNGELDGRKIGRRLVITAESAKRYAADLPQAKPRGARA